MKTLKIIGFFFAGVIVQLLFYGLSVLSMIGLHLAVFIWAVAIVTGAGVFLGVLSVKTAKKLKLRPVCGIIPYIVGNFAVITAAIACIEINMPYIGPNTGLGSLPNFGRSISYSLVILFSAPAFINLLVQIIWGIFRVKKSKNQKNKEEE